MQTRLFRIHISRWTSWACVVLQIASLTGIAALNFFDERLETVSFGSILAGRVGTTPLVYPILLPLLLVMFVVSFGLFAAGLFVGERSQRSVRNILLLTSIVAAALTLYSNWQQISWEGRRYRMRARIQSIQVLCDSLQKDWPTNDMHHDLLGPIMAYPNWAPSTLILLTPKPVDDRICIAAIDRSRKGVLRFELSTGYDTIWLEHRTDSALDAKFINGIEEDYTLQHYVSLSPSWFLVRYQ